MWMKHAFVDARWQFSCGLMAAVMAFPATGWAQASPPDEGDDLGEEESEEAESGPGQLPSEEESAPSPRTAGPEQPPAPPAPPPTAAAAPPSPFVFTLKGMITGTVFTQDVPTLSGNGGPAIFGPLGYTQDKWFLGGDIRQSRLLFSVKGPEVLSGATPTGVMELDLSGGNQITTVPGATQLVTIRDAMGMTIGTGGAASVTSSAQGDESLLPRVRVAYVELNWGMGENIIRVGQFHNLLLPMIAASASHTGTPLGYGAGQLGWRSPGITYLHRSALSEDMNLDIGLQINRNSWIDNFASCAPTQMPPPTTPNCLPAGVSLGEASMLPQFEARVMLSGGKAASPWPYYAPNIWQAFVVGHYDVKDLSGVGSDAPPGVEDAMSTYAVEAGFKVNFAPVLIAGNFWLGKNTGNIYGNLIQMQLPGAADVSGLGGWAQIGFSFTPELSLWAFGGIDKPNEDEAQAVGFTRLQNVQLAGMLAYVQGPIVLGLEYLNIATESVVAPAMPMSPTNPTGSLAVVDTLRMNQIAATLMYNF
jgi:hypothetical protein